MGPWGWPLGGPEGACRGGGWLAPLGAPHNEVAMKQAGSKKRLHTDRIAQLEEQINVLQQTIRQLGDGLAEAAGVNEELKQELNAERLEVIGAIARKEAAMRESAAKEEVIINQLHNLGELRRELDALKAEVR